MAKATANQIWKLKQWGVEHSPDITAQEAYELIGAEYKKRGAKFEANRRNARNGGPTQWNNTTTIEVDGEEYEQDINPQPH